MDIIKELAMGVAIRFHLIDIPETMTYMETYDDIHALFDDEAIWVWEAFEFWELDSLVDSIWNLYQEVLIALTEGSK